MSALGRHDYALFDMMMIDSWLWALGGESVRCCWWCGRRWAASDGRWCCWNDSLRSAAWCQVHPAGFFLPTAVYWGRRIHSHAVSRRYRRVLVCVAWRSWDPGHHSTCSTPARLLQARRYDTASFSAVLSLHCNLKLMSDEQFRLPVK